MLLNYLWIAFFLVAIVVALITSITSGTTEIFGIMVEALFGGAKSGFEISLGLVGILTFWQGLLRVGEKGGIIASLSRATAPFFAVLFPSLPKGHDVGGTMVMNFSANLLGLDNAATPLGLNVMQQLQTLNTRDKGEASDAMIMFLCINASGLTLIPISIIMYRLQLGSSAPSDVFLPILLATAASTLTAILLVALRQRINLLKCAFMLPTLLFALIVGGLLFAFSTLPRAALTEYSTAVSHLLLLGCVAAFLISGIRAKRNVYEDFINGAKEGFTTAVTIIPYLVAILVAIGVFRASGAMDMLMELLRQGLGAIHINTAWIDALPTMLMKPLSGSGARGLMIDAMQTHGADSFVGRLACMVQGASDTTFYIIALYYGSIAVRRTRYTLSVSLIADAVGMLCAVLLAYLFFAD